MTAPFYALQVTSEARASDDLNEAGFEYWAPTFKCWRPGAQWVLRNVAGRERLATRAPAPVSAPLFQGYVFVRIAEDQFPEVLDMARVTDVVRGAGGAPWPIPESLIGETLRATLTGEHDERMPPPPKVWDGPRVKKAAKAAVPMNRARSRAQRKKATMRLRRWLDDAEGRPLQKPRNLEHIPPHSIHG